MSRTHNMIALTSTISALQAENKRLRKIEAAAVIVMAGLNNRIDAAANDTPGKVPVFDGIGQLHDALFNRSVSGLEEG